VNIRNLYSVLLWAFVTVPFQIENADRKMSRDYKYAPSDQNDNNNIGFDSYCVDHLIELGFTFESIAMSVGMSENRLRIHVEKLRREERPYLQQSDPSAKKPRIKYSVDAERVKALREQQKSWSDIACDVGVPYDYLLWWKKKHGYPLDRPSKQAKLEEKENSSSDDGRKASSANMNRRNTAISDAELEATVAKILRDRPDIGIHMVIYALVEQGVGFVNVVGIWRCEIVSC
jgi:hypothetical protein